MMNFDLSLVLLALCLLGLLLVFLKIQALEKKELKPNLDSLFDLIQKPILDLTDRTTKLSMETREATTEKLQQQFSESRKELQENLLKSTQALEKRFESLQMQVEQKLQVIGANVESKLNENLKEGFKHFEKVQEHLKTAELKLQSLNTVGESISNLNSLLKLPHLRGGFGELTLERLLQDFLPNNQFELQYCITPGSQERVDAVVKLHQKVLPIDSKFPREQVLPLFESDDPIAIQGAKKNLADYVKSQSKSIKDKYIKPEHGTTEMALLFLPSETLYFEVIQNGTLFEEISKLRVFPVSPNTLSITLFSVQMAQEYYQMSKGVEKTIQDIQKAQKHFSHFENKFEDIGKGLRKAQDAFETANTHLGRYESSVTRLVGHQEELEMISEKPAEL